ncbi:MAG: hypothetical protein KAS49_00145 [Candidatus Cloacimonetes bacterium]|nr:hypothetical protein [Candidatus Cloacimonadota bacterium]
MHKFLALVKKDWYINKKAVLIPFWIVGGFYLINIIIMLVAYFTGQVDSMFSFPTNGVTAQMMSYFANSIIVIFPGLLALLFVIICSQNALNEDKRRKCELFHCSQPVSIWQRTGSKYTVGIFSNLVVFIIISILNFLVLNVILLFLDGFSISAAIQGLIQAQIVYIKSAIVIGSIGFFVSSIFEQSAFFKFIAILIAVNIIIVVLNTIYGWRIPSPLKYVKTLIENTPKLPENQSLLDVDFAEVIKQNWARVLFNVKTIWQLVVSGVLFMAGTYIYGRKEIK